MPRNIFEKIWDAHTVKKLPGTRTVIFVDRHLLHEVTSPQAFNGLYTRSLKVHDTSKTFATEDHNVPTNEERFNDPATWKNKQSGVQVTTLRENCEKFGVKMWNVNSGNQGIVHVIGPELGLIQPGMTTVCGDSHTSTHGAFGAYSLGIGTTEIEMVLASQCMILEKPKTFEIKLNGTLKPYVSAKDVILHIIRELGVDKGTGHVFIYRGDIFGNMSMEERMTICNMSIEAGARAGIIEPDQTTIEYLRNREYSPKAEEFEAKAKEWLEFRSDAGAKFDESVEFKAEDIKPMVTWGTNPAMGISLDEDIPDPKDFVSEKSQKEATRAEEYMNVKPHQKLTELKINTVFIGSCTNSRIEDLRIASEIFRKENVKDGVRVLIVPGSMNVKKKAEKEGLDKIFTNAGCEWRNPGCSMCIAMNDDFVKPYERCATTSNRNFEGRQGKNSRSHLCSPAMAAVSAILGRFPAMSEYVSLTKNNE